MLANTELDGRMDREGIVKEKEEQMRDLWDFFHMQGVGSYLAGLDGEDVRREGDAPGTQCFELLLLAGARWAAAALGVGI
jgi:hypothetical protein